MYITTLHHVHEQRSIMSHMHTACYSCGVGIISVHKTSDDRCNHMYQEDFAQIELWFAVPVWYKLCHG